MGFFYFMFCAFGGKIRLLFSWGLCVLDNYLLFVGVFFLLFRLPWKMNYLGQGAGEKRSVRQIYIVHPVSKTAKVFKHHGILICLLNKSIKRNHFRALFHGVYEEESLFLRKVIYFSKQEFWLVCVKNASSMFLTWELSVYAQ